MQVRVTDKMVEALKAARSSDAVAVGGGPAEVKYTRYEASPAPRGWEDYTGQKTLRTITISFATFYGENDRFTKTGSGQTSETSRRDDWSYRACELDPSFCGAGAVDVAARAFKSCSNIRLRRRSEIKSIPLRIVAVTCVRMYYIIMVTAKPIRSV